jgi:hypothetical protein
MIFENEIAELLGSISSFYTNNEKESILRDLCNDRHIPLDLVRYSREARKMDKARFLDSVLSLCDDPEVFVLFEESIDQFEACPASTKYHSAYFGGLLDHTFTVCECMHDLLDRFNPEGNNALFRNSAFKVALLHDVGKMGTIDIPMYIVNPDFTKHNKEPFIWNEALPQMPHEMYSLYLIHRYKIMLSAEEWQAITYHNGYYAEGAMQALRSKECPLTLLLHTADNFANKLRGC